MPQLYEYIYVSRTLIPPHSVDMLDIQRAALRNNSRQGLTGMLFFDTTFFLQIIEGEDGPIQTLLSSLRKDSRHVGMLALRTRSISERKFGDWGMAFCDGTSSDRLFGFAPGHGVLMAAEAGQSDDILRQTDAILPGRPT